MSLDLNKEKNISIDLKNLKNILKTIDRDITLKIVCNNNVYSICSLFIFITILKKEYIKYIIEFRNNTNNKYCFYFNYKDTFHYLNNKISLDFCQCNNILFIKNNLIGPYLMYLFAKSIDYLNINTIWPFLIIFSFYKSFNHKKCDFCNDLINDLKIQLKILNSYIFHDKKLKINFINHSNLFLALKNDINLIFNKKNSKLKIFELLAKNGISIKNSYEEYKNLSSLIKNKLKDIFGEDETFNLKFDYNTEIIGIEHFFLLQHYLNKRKPLHSFLCLNKSKLLNFNKSYSLYHRFIYIFKEIIKKPVKAGQIMIFTIENSLMEEIKYKNENLKENENNKDFYFIDYNFLSILYFLLDSYLDYKYENKFLILIKIIDKDLINLYGLDFDFSVIYETNDKHNLIINKNEYKSIIKEILKYQDLNK